MRWMAVMKEVYMRYRALFNQKMLCDWLYREFISPRIVRVFKYKA
jgi:hypothetical protein